MTVTMINTINDTTKGATKPKKLAEIEATKPAAIAAMAFSVTDFPNIEFNKF